MTNGEIDELIQTHIDARFWSSLNGHSQQQIRTIVREAAKAGAQDEAEEISLMIGAEICELTESGSMVAENQVKALRKVLNLVNKRAGLPLVKEHI